MNGNKKLYLAVLSVVIVVSTASFYIYRDITGVKTTSSDNKTGNNASTSQNNLSKVQELPKTAVLPAAAMPDLNRPVKFENNLGADFEKIMTEKILTLQKSLKVDPAQFRLWMDLAGDYKIIADYNGAEEVWIYASIMIPDNPVALGNLANLYAYDLKNLQKADEYYNLTVNVAGALPYNYFQASDFYLNLKKDKNKAIAVVELGLKKYPKDPDLMALLASLKSE